MLLYHLRDQERPGTLDARDEEECFTAAGRRIGVWLTTEPSTDPRAFAADVDVETVADFEVTAADAPNREFVVPAAVVATLGFACA